MLRAFYFKGGLKDSRALLAGWWVHVPSRVLENVQHEPGCGSVATPGLAVGLEQCGGHRSESPVPLAASPGCPRCHPRCGARRDLVLQGWEVAGGRWEHPGAFLAPAQPSAGESCIPGPQGLGGCVQQGHPGAHLCPSSAGTRALSRTAPAGSSMPPAFRRSISSSSPSATQLNLPPLFSTFSTRTR